MNPPIALATVYHTNTSQIYPPTIVTGTITAAGMTISACRNAGTGAVPVNWLALGLT